MLVETAGCLSECTKRLVEDFALADQPAKAVSGHQGESAAVQQSLEGLLTGLLRLEAGPLVGTARRAESGCPQIGFGLFEPNVRVRRYHDDTIPWPRRLAKATIAALYRRLHIAIGGQAS